MATKKTATLNLRINPLIKDALKGAAARQHRSVANMVELLILEHCKAEGLPVALQSTMFGDDE